MKPDLHGIVCAACESNFAQEVFYGPKSGQIIWNGQTRGRYGVLQD
jgi:hypothetical protein